MIIVYLYYFVDLKIIFYKILRSIFPYQRQIPQEILLNNLKLLADDGMIDNSNNCIVIKSSFKKILQNGKTCNRFVVYNNLSLKSDDNIIKISFNGEFMMKLEKDLLNEILNGISPDDFRLGFGAVGFFNEDIFVQLAFSSDMIFVLYGIVRSDILRDKWICMHRIKKSSFGNSYEITLNRYGKCQVINNPTENNDLLLEISNISIPNMDHLIHMNTSDEKKFNSKPIFIENLNISIGIHTLFIASDFKNKNISLYNDQINDNYVKIGNSFIKTDVIIKSSDSSILNMGQQCEFKVSNLKCICN